MDNVQIDIKSCTSSKGHELGMNSDPVGKTLIVGNDLSGWFAGTWTFVVGVGLGVVGIPLCIVARSFVVHASVAIELSMARLLAVEALLLGFGFGSVIARLVALAFVLVAVADEVVLLHIAVNGADNGIFHVVLFLHGEHSWL